MTMTRLGASFALLALCLTTVSSARAADHLDAPLLQMAGAGDRDINDLYAFQSPTNPDNTVLVMTVNPFAGVMNPFGTTSPTTFGTDVTYEFQIDNTGDAVADVTYATTFGASVAGSQALTTTLGGAPYATGATGSAVATSGGGAVQAGLFDDPFFFDLVGFNDGFNFTGDDTFAGANVSAIVLEVPSSELGGPNVGIWARTTVGGMQIDRMGRPAISTALIPSGMKDAFNAGAPADDVATFTDEVEATITSLSSMENAEALSPILLPDVLTIDTSDSSGFLNGRGLTDDVIDAELNLLSAGGVTTDMVDANDVAFPGVFPYLAPANAVIPEPATAALLLVAAASGVVARRSRR